eukprot:m.81937 g.81937  ORF g.81937 m.81937 type:complete len:314 (+) comp12841_c0_seq1:147-1088(+)
MNRLHLFLLAFCTTTVLCQDEQHMGLLQPNKLLLAARGLRTGEPLRTVYKPSYVLTVENSLFVSCFWHDQVVQLHLNSQGSVEPKLTIFASGHGLDGPWGLAVKSNILFVASFTTDAIHKYSLSDGKMLGYFGNEDELDCPEGIAFGPDDNLYVISFLADEVVKYSQDGEYLGVVAKGGLSGPEDVAFLPSGDFVVSSHYSNTLEQYSTQGVWKGTFANISKPVGVTRGPDDNIYVASYESSSVWRFDGVSGEFMDIFATGGHLNGPSALTFASARVLYICSYDNDKVVLYNSTEHLSYSIPKKFDTIYSTTS